MSNESEYRATVVQYRIDVLTDLLTEDEKTYVLKCIAEHDAAIADPEKMDKLATTYRGHMGWGEWQDHGRKLLKRRLRTPREFWIFSPGDLACRAWLRDKRPETEKASAEALAARDALMAAHPKVLDAAKAQVSAEDIANAGMIEAARVTYAEAAESEAAGAAAEEKFILKLAREFNRAATATTRKEAKAEERAAGAEASRLAMVAREAKKKAAPERRYYVYLISCLEGIIRYVGKGSGDRWMAHMRRKELAEFGELDVKVRFCADEVAALKLEAELIIKHSTPDLFNVTGKHPAIPILVANEAHPC